MASQIRMNKLMKKSGCLLTAGEGGGKGALKELWT